MTGGAQILRGPPHSRVFLICFAERGLVAQGRPNLRLFHQLYWILFSVFIAIGIITFPVMKFLRGNFAETTNGKICLLIPLEPDGVRPELSRAMI